MSFLKTIMVYPQCLLNFIELLYSWGAAHGNTVQTVWDILRKRVSPVPCFQTHTLTSLHERILPWKDTRNQANIWGFVFYMFCLERLKASPRSGLNRRISLFFLFCGMRMNLMTCFQKEVFFFFFPVFNLGFVQVRSLYVCVRVFCIPIWVASWSCAVTKDKMYITRSIVMFQGKGWPLVVNFLLMIPFGAHLLSASPVCLSWVSIVLSRSVWERIHRCADLKKKKRDKTQKTCEFFRFPVCVSHLLSPQWMGSGNPLWQRRVFPMP